MSVFREKVRAIVRNIPSGKTMTYREVAEKEVTQKLLEL